MGVTLNPTFDTKRQAEMTVERLVQQFGLDQDALSITMEGDENIAGEEQAGSDTEAGHHSAQACGDTPLDGAIVVMIDVADVRRPSGSVMHLASSSQQASWR